MRHLAPTYLVSTLLRGKSVEQFMGGSQLDSEPAIRWTEIRPSDGDFEVWDFIAPDWGSEDRLDLYGFIGDEDGELVSTANDANVALSLAQERLGASPDRWVNQFVIQDEYRDFIRAGRPAPWPGVVA